MSERLGQIGGALSNLSDAVKMLKSVREENSQLYSIIETTKKKAYEVDKLNIPNEPLLQELKQDLQKVRDLGSKLEVWLQSFGRETDSFNRYVKENIERKGIIPLEVVAEFCKRLTRMHSMASDFSKAFNDFIGCLTEAQKSAGSLEKSLKKKADEMEQEASSAEKTATAKTVGLALAGGVGLAALAFFTGGIALAAAAGASAGVAGVSAGAAGATAAAVAGASAGVAGAAAGALVARGINSTSVANVKEMRELASGILESAKKLGVIALELKSSSDKAGGIRLDESAMEHLQTVLEFFRSFQQRDEVIADQQETITDQQSRIAELEAQIRSMRH